MGFRAWDDATIEKRLRREDVTGYNPTIPPSLGIQYSSDNMPGVRDLFEGWARSYGISLRVTKERGGNNGGSQVHTNFRLAPEPSDRELEEVTY
mgnify:CR=1 FL=1